MKSGDTSTHRFAAWAAWLFGAAGIEGFYGSPSLALVGLRPTLAWARSGDSEDAAASAASPTDDERAEIARVRRELAPLDKADEAIAWFEAQPSGRWSSFSEEATALACDARAALTPPAAPDPRRSP